MEEDRVELRTCDERFESQPKESILPGNGRQVVAVSAILCSTAIIIFFLASQSCEQSPSFQHNLDHPVWQGPSIELWQDVHWRGYTVMREGKGYAATPMGQVHYRDVGPRNCRHPVVLLHQSPMSMLEWASVQNELVMLGIRIITVDTPGYGMSDLPPVQPSISEFADNLIPVLNHLQLERVVVGGHFTGALIAASFAAKYPERASGVVLHGIHGFTVEGTAHGVASVENAMAVPPAPDGSHFFRLFQRWNETRQAPIDALTALMVSRWMSGPDIGHYAAYRYTKEEMDADLTAIQAPGLLLADDDGILPEDSVRAQQLRPDFKFEAFGGSMFSLQMEPARWARIVATFLRSLNE